MASRLGGKRLSLRGNLSATECERILSLIHVDASVVQEAERAQRPGRRRPPSLVCRKGCPKIRHEHSRATRRYFRHNRNLSQGPGKSRVTDFSQVGLWMQNYSRRIQSLQTANVDQMWYLRTADRPADEPDGKTICMGSARTRRLKPLQSPGGQYPHGRPADSIQRKFRRPYDVAVCSDWQHGNRYVGHLAARGRRATGDQSVSSGRSSNAWPTRLAAGTDALDAESTYGKGF